MLLVLMVAFLVPGAILGLIGRWHIWLLFAIVAVASFLGASALRMLPLRAGVFNDDWSFLYFRVNHGVNLGLVAGAGASGVLLGWFVMRKRGKRQETCARCPAGDGDEGSPKMPGAVPAPMSGKKAWPKSKRAITVGFRVVKG